MIVIDSSDSSTNSPPESSSVTSSKKRPRLPQTSQSRSKKPALDSQPEEDCLIEQALSLMKQDEYDIFGQFVANELRQMASPSLRHNVKHQIMRTLMSAPYQQHPNSNSNGTTIAYSNSSSNIANNVQQYSYQNVPCSADDFISIDASYPNNFPDPISADFQLPMNSNNDINTSILQSTQTQSENHAIVYDDIIVYTDIVENDV